MIGTLSDFVRTYLETILFAETDNATPSGGEPLDKNFDISNFSPEAITLAKEDSDKFLEIVKAELPFVIEEAEDTELAKDFWFTRTGHGSGFWDGDYDWLDRDGIEVGDKLTEIAKRFKHIDAYIGDDKVIYLA